MAAPAVAAPAVAAPAVAAPAAGAYGYRTRGAHPPPHEKGMLPRADQKLF